MNSLDELMVTMVKINDDLADEVKYISTTDDLTTGRFTTDDLTTIYDGADSLSTLLQRNKHKHYYYISVCEAIKVRALFIYFKIKNNN